ncbi:MAG: hypothetical protein JOZ69_22105, partial [Myxococcales bacterium]|nr:hypothetical protein [Myxococcales bacterium]
MSVYSAIHRGGLRRWSGVGAAVLVALSAACSFILDHGSAQCQGDGDCVRFGGRPSCQNGVCVDLGQGPKNCFFGAPDAAVEFANQCTAAECLAFNDCDRLGICNGAAGPAPVSPPPADGGAATDAGSDGADQGLPNCVDPMVRAKPIYITGSSNFPPLLQKLAPIIVGAGFTPIFLVTNSCTGVKTMLSASPTDRTIADPPRGSALTKYAQFFDSSGGATPCLLGGAQQVDVGESDVFSEDCDPFMPADKYPNVSESFGPTQAMA